MKRSDNLVICDYHKRGGNPDWHCEVLDDGMTFRPGYITAQQEGIYQLLSNDPNNDSKQIGVLRNRHVDDNGNPLTTKLSISDVHLTQEDKSIYHFCSVVCLHEWFKTYESKKSKTD